MSTMSVLSKLKAEPGIWLDQAPIPTIKSDEVLVKIHKTAICGTDLHIYKWDEWAQKTIPVPMHVGHEFMGTIAEIGSAVQGFKVGDRVSGEGHIVCHCCRNCRTGKPHLCPNTSGVGVNRPGAFAEYLAIPAYNTFKVPNDISDDLVSIFDPLGNAVHTALSFDLVGQDVLITGAGPIGIMAAAICRHVGARKVVITDMNPYRLKLAEQFGVDLALDLSGCQNSNEMTERLNQASGKLGLTEGFQVGLEMSGNGEAINTMINTVSTGARIALLGIAGKSVQLDWDKVVFKSLILKGIYGREMFDTWYKMVALLQSGLDLSPIITHHFPVKDYIQGFETMKSGQCGKVILDWTK